jgi:single-strand DNA-binding protein
VSGVNKVIILGRLGRDPETRAFASGGKVVNLRIATSERWKDKTSGEMQERTEWHAVAIFNEKLGEIAERYLRKGSEVYVEGALETRKWTDNSGAERFMTEIVLRQFRGELALVGGKRDDAPAAAPAPAGRGKAPLEDEIPFGAEMR